MYGYVYETINLVNNKRYIGQHTSCEFDPQYKGSGVYLKNAISKYGWDNFESRILCQCFSKDELDSEEIFLIKYYNAVNSKEYYNLSAGGDGWRKGSKHSESYKLLRCREGNPNYGKSASKETRSKMSEAHSGENNFFYSKSLSYDHRRKISESCKSAELLGFKGHHHTEETKLRISNSKLGSYPTDETKEKLSKALQGNTRTKDRVWITNGIRCRMVKLTELDNYILEGYSLGRIINNKSK